MDRNQTFPLIRRAIADGDEVIRTSWQYDEYDNYGDFKYGIRGATIERDKPLSLELDEADRKGMLTWAWKNPFSFGNYEILVGVSE